MSGPYRTPGVVVPPTPKRRPVPTTHNSFGEITNRWLRDWAVERRDLEAAEDVIEKADALADAWQAYAADQQQARSCRRQPDGAKWVQVQAAAAAYAADAAAARIVHWKACADKLVDLMSAAPVAGANEEKADGK